MCLPCKCGLSCHGKVIAGCSSTQPPALRIRGVCLASDAKLDQNTSSFSPRTARFAEADRYTYVWPLQIAGLADVCSADQHVEQNNNISLLHIPVNTRISLYHCAVLGITGDTAGFINLFSKLAIACGAGQGVCPSQSDVMMGDITAVHGLGAAVTEGNLCTWRLWFFFSKLLLPVILVVKHCLGCLVRCR